MIGILLPTRGRLEFLETSLLSISSQVDQEIELVVVVDDDSKTSLYLSSLSNVTNSFSQFRLIESKTRLFAVKAFNYALINCESDVFVWLSNLNVFIDEFCLDDLVNEFFEKFPDGNGVMSLNNNSGAAFGISSKKFIEYNENEWFFQGYKVHYCDVELTHRAILLGKYSCAKEDYLFHNKVARGLYPEISLVDKYTMKMQDKLKYRERRDKKFYLPSNKIVNPNHNCVDFVEAII